MVHPDVLRIVASRAVALEPTEEVEVSAPGAPGIDTLRVAAAPLRIVAIDGEALTEPIPFELAQPLWRPVVHCGMAPEPDWQGGREVLRSVDTHIYGWQLTCACQRVRYAKANCKHQIRACRVCTRRERLSRRAKRQRESRQ